MAGRAPIKVYIYRFDGKYLGFFDNITMFRGVYFPEQHYKKPLFTKNELGCDYEILDDCEIVAVQEKIGRETIKKIVAIDKSEFCKNEDNFSARRPVQVYNMKGELIAEFKTQRLLTKMMPHINQPTLTRQLKKGGSTFHAHLTTELFFKFKD